MSKSSKSSDSYKSFSSIQYPSSMIMSPSNTPTKDTTTTTNSPTPNAHRLSQSSALQLYCQNASRSPDMAVQFDFALYMLDHAYRQNDEGDSVGVIDSDPAALKEVERQALRLISRLANRGFPAAQYYLGDCYSNGICSRDGTPDNEKALALFILASKHNHAEASYRAGLCYEHGWGCRTDNAKAMQYQRKAASLHHPGAMSRLAVACLYNQLGLTTSVREGVTWLKRAAEVATEQYPSAPYELALLHENGLDDIVFRDLAYMVELLSLAASLGHAEAAYRLGEAYEAGLLECPADAELSVHYFTLAAMKGHARAMLALCAWYISGSPGVLDRDEREAYHWAKAAAEKGLSKAEFVVGFLSEKGLGTPRNELEANKYYVLAADHGDARAKQRVAQIHAQQREAVQIYEKQTNTGSTRGRNVLTKKKQTKQRVTSVAGDRDGTDCRVM